MRKIFTILIILLLLMSPIVLLFLPSWDSKLNPMLNLVDTMFGAGGADQMGLGGFGFVEADEDTITLRLDLSINNSKGGDMIFPALNLTFKYGASTLGYGWINPEVFIPAGEEAGLVSIFAKMFKGDGFNQLLMGLIAGSGLSLSIAAGEAFVYLDSYFGPSGGVISIPLPAFPIPSIDLGESGPWAPTIHTLTQANVTANQPVDIAVEVSDKGGGVAECILSWNNGTAWQNTTLPGLPFKAIFGGNATILGQDLNSKFPAYPASPIPTTWKHATVNATIPGYGIGTAVQYRVYIIDDFGYTTVVPSTTPTSFTGNSTPVSYDLTNMTFSYTVGAITSDNFTADWTENKQDIFSDLEAQGIDIMGALLAGSDAFAILADTSNLTAEVIQEFIFGLILPMVEYLDFRGVNPFEVVDQLLGLSGGVPGLDDNITANANASLALDLLAEGGVSLLDLISLLSINVTRVVDALGDSITPQLVEGDTLGEALLTLLNATFSDSLENASFQTFLNTYDAHYIDFDLFVWKYNTTAGTYTDLSAEAASANVSNDVPLRNGGETLIYFGSETTKDLLGADQPGPDFAALQFVIGTPNTDPQLGTLYQWEYYNGSTWLNLPLLSDETENLTKSGRLFFDFPSSMQSVAVNGTDTHWIRVNITAPLAGAGPIADTVAYSLDFVPYYIDNVGGDIFGRTAGEVIPGESDTINNLLRTMNASNGYATLIWGLLSYKGVGFETFVDEIGGTLVTVQGPVMGAEIVTTTSTFMGLIMYGLLLLGVAAAMGGRKGTYAISPIRVRKWYDSMMVTPSLKTREELEKLKTFTKTP